MKHSHPTETRTADQVIRVAQIIGIAIDGGVESTMMNYYRHVDRSRVQFDFFVENESKLINREEIEAMGGRVVIIPPYKKVGKFMKTLTRLFREGGYDVVHSNLNALSGFPLRAAKRAGIRYRVLHNHSTSGKGEFLKNMVKALLRPSAKRWATHYCACSELAAEWMYGKKKVAQGKIQIWHNAVDLERFAFSPARREEIRAAYGWEGKHIIGHIGRFIHQKNHAFLLDIFSALHKMDPTAHLVLLGQGDLKQMIEDKIRALGLEDAVTLVGTVTNVPDFYSAMDAFLLPSFYEGLPVSGVEAQAEGLPCIFSDAVTAESVLLDTTRVLSLRDSAETWASELLKMVTTPVDRVSPAGREKLEEKFDSKITGKEMTAYYLNMLATKK